MAQYAVPTAQSPRRDSHGRFVKAQVAVSSPTQVKVKPELEKPVSKSQSTILLKKSSIGLTKFAKNKPQHLPSNFPFL